MSKSSLEKAVIKRYTRGALTKETELCCPVSYDPKYLKVIPKEVLEKDYGCGDPSRYLWEGDRVLDLGCGSGKICYIASQVVGARGKVIGVDFNPEMLALAKKHQREVARRIGWDNIRFVKSRIQDLKIKSESINVIISNCVLNLVRPEDKKKLFREMHRVLVRGGRIAISDIVSDEEVPEKLKRDTELWSGCISGAFQEDAFLRAFEEAGFYGVQIEKLDVTPWRVVQGIEFRSMTVTAYKGKEGACWERNQAVIYKGPWKQVVDDDKHVLKRGIRTAVCDKTYQIYSKAPYRNEIIWVPPQKNIPLSKAKPFDCKGAVVRDPRETKGMRYRKTTKTKSVCMDGGCC